MNTKQLLFFCTICLFFIDNTFSQSTGNKYVPKGFDFFFNSGMYKGHKFNANYYRGIPDEMNRRYGDPDINYIFGNKYWMDDMLNLIDANNTGIILEKPSVHLSEMRYGLAFYFEVGARYRFNESFMLSFLFGQARLSASGTAGLGFKGTGVNLDMGTVYLQYPVIGKERRNFFQAQITYLFHTTIDYIFPFVDLGVHLNSVKVMSSELFIEEVPFDMINRYEDGYSYVPGDNAQE
ncbi:MAG: hypothetical protein LBH82_05295, partial [Bacteroidales bacterium]|nr:hypothetical protein [Bacteroidales bacterium]